ncbi:unnamed protein product [Prunus armeniaca]|uniref:Uncharacterized protein n=1 Tax=Prunus armeniaca TaxID=36596 RepID=A0A6J5WDL1_PRUAR|nr:unnamed protein product [Prunus armeniaca]
MRAYRPMIHPMTSEDLWPKCHRPPLMPPFYHKQPGRTRKKRKRSAGEQPPNLILQPPSCRGITWKLPNLLKLHMRLKQPKLLKLPHLLKLLKLLKLPKKRKRFKSLTKRIKLPKKKDGSQTVQGSESVQTCPGSQTGQCSQPAQTSQTVHGSQPSTSSSHPFANGTNKKGFKSLAKRKKFTNRKDLLDGYQPWRF